LGGRARPVWNTRNRGVYAEPRTACAGRGPACPPPPPGRDPGQLLIRATGPAGR